MRCLFRPAAACSLALCGLTAITQAQSPQQSPPSSQAQPPRQQAQPQQPAQPGSPFGAGARPQPARQVVAMVNGQPITRSELKSAVEPQLKNVDPDDPKMVQQIRQQVLNSLIEGRLVEQHLISNGPKISDQEVKAVIGGYKRQIESQGVPFDQFLRSKGYTQSGLEQRVKGSLAWQKYQQQEVTEEKLQRYFADHQAQFQTDDFVQARPQVTQSYVGQLWTDIVRKAQPNAEVKTVAPTSQQQPKSPTGGTVPTVPPQ